MPLPLSFTLIKTWAPLPPEGGFKDPNYKHEPTIWVSTKKIGDKVFISVKDNGPGIPQKILDKIFQPFFTTKPTGQGTGLGLSLSYDIVKAHGGELNVETKEGEGSEFIIQLLVEWTENYTISNPVAKGRKIYFQILNKYIAVDISTSIDHEDYFSYFILLSFFGNGYRTKQKAWQSWSPD